MSAFRLSYIFLGDTSPESPTRKRVMLTGYLAIISFLVSTYYIIFDWVQGKPGYLYIYLVLIASSVISIILLRKKHYSLGKMLLLLAALAVIAIFSSAEPSDTGIDFYYVIICMGSLTLFDYEKIKLGIVLCLITVSTFLIIQLTDFQFIPDVDIYNDAESVFLTNFFVSVVSAILIIYYLMSTNYHAQKELLKTADELAKSKRKFEMAIRGSSAGIWSWQFETNLLYISPQMARMLGYDEKAREGITEEEFMSFIHPADLDLVREEFNSHLKKLGRFEVECRIQKKDGDYIWVLDTGQAEWNEDGKPIRMVGSIVDITERRAAEKEVYESNSMLRKTNEELDRFVYSTSHDLRAPLSSVLGLIQLAQVSDDDQEREKCLNLMKERINTLNGFIQDIISYSRNSRLGIEYHSINFPELIEDILVGLEFFEHQKNIKIIHDYDKSFKLISDRSRLRVILNNLITNAIKYHDMSKDEPYIKIRAVKKQQIVEIEIEDNGTGIDETMQNKIFNMFYRASEDSDGSGLGLYIAREMSEKLKGHLSVTSQKGDGTTFSLALPVNKERETV